MVGFHLRPDLDETVDGRVLSLKKISRGFRIRLNNNFPRAFIRILAADNCNRNVFLQTRAALT